LVVAGGAGIKQEFARMEVTAQNVTTSPANQDGTITFKTLVNGTFNTLLTLNGSSQEIEVGKNIDLNGNTINTSQSNLTITSAASSGTGTIILTPKVAGNLIINNLPTSTVGLPANAVWNNSGILQIGTSIPLSNVSSGTVNVITLNQSPTTTSFNGGGYYANSWSSTVTANRNVIPVFSKLIINGVYKLFITNNTIGSSYSLQFTANAGDTIYTNFGGSLTLNNNQDHVFNIIYVGSNKYYIENVGNFI